MHAVAGAQTEGAPSVLIFSWAKASWSHQFVEFVTICTKGGGHGTAQESYTHLLNTGWRSDNGCQSADGSAKPNI